MTRIKSRSVVLALALGALVAGTSGCKKEGPAERAGRQIDESAQKAGQQIDKSAEKAGRQLEKTGDNVKDAVKDLKK